MKKNSFLFFGSLAFSSAAVTAVLCLIIALISGGNLPDKGFIYAIFAVLLLIFYRNETNSSRGAGV
jgi:polyferredoxin